MGVKKLFVLVALVSGCASYQTKVGAARNQMQNGHADEAAKMLEPLAMKDGDDQLVYLLDYAMALQVAGRYDDSIKAFLKSSDLAEIKDYHSISRVAGSILLNEGMVQYKGEDYEKLLIHVFLAQNYLMKNNFSDAMVEIRALNTMLDKYRLEAKRDYEQNPFAIYLSAILWESDRKWDDAYIAYKQVYKLHPDIPLLKEDLVRTSLAARRQDEHADWKKTFPDVKVEKWWKDPLMGELVVIYQQGKGPVKLPNPAFIRVPKLYPVHTSTSVARLEIDGVGSFDSEPIYSIQDTAIKTLDDAYAGLVAKRVAGIATKAVVADQVGKKDPLLGQLAWIGMNLMDQADLRQWSTLPESLQVIRVPLKSGDYHIHVAGLNSSKGPTGEKMNEQIVKVSAKQKTFVLWRSFQ